MKQLDQAFPGEMVQGFNKGMSKLELISALALQWTLVRRAGHGQEGCGRKERVDCARRHS